MSDRLIPVDVLESADLSSSAKLIFGVVSHDAWSRRTDLTTISNATIADAMGMAPASVRRPIRELETAGLISRTRSADGRVIRVLYRPTPYELGHEY